MGGWRRWIEGWGVGGWLEGFAAGWMEIMVAWIGVGGADGGLRAEDAGCLVGGYRQVLSVGLIIDTQVCNNHQSLSHSAPPYLILSI